ncbi:MAG TPA: hypothetical protein VJH23_03825 [archaeon]|nr:hypothetical protein [archaeon]
MIRELLSNWRIIVFIVALLGALAILTFQGPDYGLEFTGGTYFQIKLEDSLSTSDLERVVQLISRRIDAFGLKDSRVNSLGPDLVGAQIAETDPEKIAEIEALIKTQAKFESMLDGNVLFTGADFKNVSKDPASGYGTFDAGNGTVEWRLPFVLSQVAAEKFSKGIFHKCTAVGYENSVVQYDCAKTYFFIDRPQDGVILLPQSVYAQDLALLAIGNVDESIPAGLSVEELMQNSGVPYFVISDTNGASESQLLALESIAAQKKKAIVHSGISGQTKSSLQAMGFKVIEVGASRQNIPWIWLSVGARQAIGIDPEIAGMNPYIEDVKNAKIYSSLYIRGFSQDAVQASAELKNLQILLETGSLPTAIESVSKETISPSLGADFLTTTLIIGISAILSVSLLIFIRYRKLRLALPVIFVGISEVLITAGFAVFGHIRFDLASMTGIIAAVGTGLNDQIVILDELLKGGGGEGESSYASRIKKAFFIVIVAAATTSAALAPLILFSSYGFGKLAGFAITEILGIMVGVLISRPAFSIIAEQILKASKR